MTDIDWRARAEAAEKRVLELCSKLSEERQAEQEGIEEYEKQLAAAREDSARLDWMIERAGALDCTDGKWEAICWNADKIGYITSGKHDTPRAAIDEVRGKK